MKNRAYSVLSVKAIDEERRIVRGIATTPSVDRVGDIIDPLGVKFTNPLAFLWQHQHDKPIGSVKFDAPTADGIGFEATLAHPDTVESVTLKDRLQEAWDSIKTGLVRAVSVGFRPIEYSYIDGGGIRFTETEVYELSAVTIPANADAIIDTIKSVDAELRAAAGVPDPEIPADPTPAATGKTVRVVKLEEPARDRAPFIIRSIKRK
ncbi:HK97 family phage prohead protease [uncultured Sphingomonas sp.]|uniref:HK97 family phage prohead protease n=1 Tax=uncultured Sphingomonas sp. TaxID=158754 RepID=UPI0025DE7288|nr:HK97 family phage prohead protease [uncultured Sphingomonas sp.]